MSFDISAHLDPSFSWRVRMSSFSSGVNGDLSTKDGCQFEQRVHLVLLNDS